ncbi:transcriptional regulator, AraC family [Parvimonas sp. oral taxon 110 str. F0139]|nr:transcriptional regulator, AraC family [Parvimonas sp. oral taxon 110 str. F0139]
MSKQKGIEIQNKANSYINEESMYSIDREIITSPTKGLFHQSARFLLIKKGTAKMRIQNNIYEIKDRTLVCILPWEYTEVIEVSKTIQYFILKYNFDSANKIIKSFYNVDAENLSLINSFYDKPVIQCTNEQFKYFSNVFDLLRAELGEDSTLYNKNENPISSAYVLNKIIDLIITYRRMQNEDTQKTKRIDEKFDKINIFRYIHAHLSEKLTISSISKLFFLSESTINRYVKETTGLSFNTLINEMRVGKTMDMLLYTDLDIEEIAEITGFSDRSHLSKVFTARTGQNPNKYRQTFQRVSQICQIENIRKFYRILNYVVKNSSDDIDLERICKDFSISLIELNKLFIYYVEKNFKNFLNFVRINKSTKLLLKTDMQITDIAFEVGYNTVKTFNRNFLKYQKMLPTEFRKNLKLQDREI